MIKVPICKNNLKYFRYSSVLLRKICYFYDFLSFDILIKPYNHVKQKNFLLFLDICKCNIKKYSFIELLIFLVTRCYYICISRLTMPKILFERYLQNKRNRINTILEIILDVKLGSNITILKDFGVYGFYIEYETRRVIQGHNFDSEQNNFYRRLPIYNNGTIENRNIIPIKDIDILY